MKFYFDEDSAHRRLIISLRESAIDIATSFDLGMNARDDESQLAMAASQQRILVSGNARDFASLHVAWLGRGQSHAGILLIPQQRYSPGEIVRRILRLNSSGVDPTSALLYLSNFEPDRTP